MTKEQAQAEAKRFGLDPEKVYWCSCCECWAHENDPCECAYDMCTGKCKEQSE